MTQSDGNYYYGDHWFTPYTAQPMTTYSQPVVHHHHHDTPAAVLAEMNARFDRITFLLNELAERIDALGGKEA